MTRQEFLGIEYWSDLIDFCADEDIGFCDEIYDETSYNDKIDDELEEQVHYDGWQDIRNWLNALPRGCEYYFRDEDNGWSEATDENFETIKDDILDFMDDNDRWEEDEEETEEYYDPEDETRIEDEDISFAELFSACNSKVQKIENDKKAEAMAFDELCVSVGITVAVEGSN